MFMTNMLLLWALDSVPPRLVIKPKFYSKLCNGDLSRERKWKVT